MSEAEIMQGLFNAIGLVMTVFSLFFTMVLGYLVALFLFLNRAPLALRLLVFGLLSIGLAFLGGSAAVIQTLQNGLFAAWSKLPSPIISPSDIRNPLPMLVNGAMPISQQELGVAIGWSIPALVYMALGYLTFVYRWPQEVPRHA